MVPGGAELGSRQMQVDDAHPLADYALSQFTVQLTDQLTEILHPAIAEGRKDENLVLRLLEQVFSFEDPSGLPGFISRLATNVITVESVFREMSITPESVRAASFEVQEPEPVVELRPALEEEDDPGYVAHLQMLGAE
ncbi:hypothetical protein J8273_3071 [Carpediemonas membranifera]|uniref:Uncharacterized protein n=1 Tax=Carpediemonas membranifera TaxID=201153 RepID=A0A8J6AYF7_9EUKA|nr:hypothetical protein J8273_3071 [Carpediemonas membranifera]|eukprot:KAG9395495.1 hypothetical protein J8273_3071 [Carpediemonas membranifera]